MSAWDQISSTYTESATQALPLHRAVVFVTGFFVSLAIQRQTHLSILETLAVVPLSEFVTFDKGVLSKAMVGNVLWALFATFIGVALSKGLIRLAYGIVQRATGAGTKAASLDKSWVVGLSIEERTSALELVESGLTEPRTRLRTLTSLNELLVGIGAILRISAIVDACFRLIVDGVSEPSWTRRDARKRGINVAQTSVLTAFA